MQLGRGLGRQLERRRSRERLGHDRLDRGLCDRNREGVRMGLERGLGHGRGCRLLGERRGDRGRVEPTALDHDLLDRASAADTLLHELAELVGAEQAGPEEQRLGRGLHRGLLEDGGGRSDELRDAVAVAVAVRVRVAVVDHICLLAFRPAEWRGPAQGRIDERKLGRDGWVGQGGFTGRSSAVRVGLGRRRIEGTIRLPSIGIPGPHTSPLRGTNPGLSCQPAQSTQVEGLVKHRGATMRPTSQCVAFSAPSSDIASGRPSP